MSGRERVCDGESEWRGRLKDRVLREIENGDVSFFSF